MSASATPTAADDESAHAYWEPRRALTLDAARRHSNFIKIARQVLIALSVFLFAALLWYFIQAPKPTPQIDNPDEAVRMENPVYKGRTSDDLPFTIMSDYAVRLIKAPDEVKLTNPRLSFIRNSSAEESLVTADTGIYNSNSQTLELDKTVSLKTDDGYSCMTSHSRVYIGEKRIEGDDPIDCQGNFGQAAGQAYAINDNFQEFVFKNGMTARIIPGEADSALRGPTDSEASPTRLSADPVSFGNNDPIDIVAQTATYRGQKTVLNGNVDVRQNDGKILADNMNIIREIVSAPTDSVESYGSIQTIIASGNFQYITPKTTVTGAKGVYERDKNIITVTGDVRYKETNGNTAKSNTMIYDLTTDAVRLEGGNDRIQVNIRNE